MVKIFVLILLRIITSAFSNDDVTAGTELMMTFLIHRHGDRTPVESLLALSTDSETLRELCTPYGYGQLTDIGMRTSYKLGEFIRNRYDELLSDTYKKSEIYIRSTDSTRAKMTTLSTMAAVYPAGEDNWSDFINWTSVPYTTVPVKYDFNMALLNCPKFISFWYSTFLGSSSSMDQYFDILNHWSNYLPVNLTEYPSLAYAVYDVYTTEKSLGMSLGDLEPLFPAIEEAAGAAIDIIFGDEDYIKLQAGPLLSEFFNKTETYMNGEDTPRVRIYSAHDFNVYSLMAVSQITPRQGVPKYGSAFALELRKVTESGNYVVLPTYLKDPNSREVVYLQVDGCEDLLCDYKTFKDITSGYAMEVDDWRTDCGFTNDLLIDLSSFD